MGTGAGRRIGVRTAGGIGIGVGVGVAIGVGVGGGADGVGVGAGFRVRSVLSASMVRSAILSQAVGKTTSPI